MRQTRFLVDTTLLAAVLATAATPTEAAGQPHAARTGTWAERVTVTAPAPPPISIITCPRVGWQPCLDGTRWRRTDNRRNLQAAEPSEEPPPDTDRVLVPRPRTFKARLLRGGIALGATAAFLAACGQFGGDWEPGAPKPCKLDNEALHAIAGIGSDAGIAFGITEIVIGW